MPNSRDSSTADFWRMMRWIAVIGVLMVIGSLSYLAMFGELRVHMVIATILGVFFSVLLGAGLFAAAFYSDKSGHDRDVTDATRQDSRDRSED